MHALERATQAGLWLLSFAATWGFPFINTVARTRRHYPPLCGGLSTHGNGCWRLDVTTAGKVCARLLMDIDVARDTPAGRPPWLRRRAERARCRLYWGVQLA